MLNTPRQCIELDGIPLVMLPKSERRIEEEPFKTGFSNASKMHLAHSVRSLPRTKHGKPMEQYCIVDIETDGLDPMKSTILELGAVREKEGVQEEFQRYIQYSGIIPESVEKLTGITGFMLQEQGVSMESALEDFCAFIGNDTVVGYNVEFDLSFINYELHKCGKSGLTNASLDLLREVKKKNLFLNNYKLQTVLKEYGIAEEVPHRALQDAKLICQLARKLNIF